MNIKEIHVSESKALELAHFKKMDYYAVEQYGLPIELMMENAGLQLANIIASAAKDMDSNILIGVGNGNNGGGGLVAARRLAAWGYPVFLDLFTAIDKELPKNQLDRAVKFGVSTELPEKIDIWVDAYLGFSQKLPLGQKLLSILTKANECDCIKIALDIPTGFLGDPTLPYFQADKTITLAAAKKILYTLPEQVELYMADLGIPKAVYDKFDVEMPPFQCSNILKIRREPIM